MPWDLANWQVYAIGRWPGQVAFHSKCIVAVWDLQGCGCIKEVTTFNIQVTAKAGSTVLTVSLVPRPSLDLPALYAILKAGRLRGSLRTRLLTIIL